MSRSTDECSPADPMAQPLTQAAHAVDRILSARAAHIVFQPVVDIQSTAVLGFEALLRGAEPGDDVPPALLFLAAQYIGKAAELDWICRVCAIDAMRHSSVDATVALFINVEPDTLAVSCPPDLVPRWDGGVADLRIVLEVTERNVAGQPGRLLQTAQWARTIGVGLAVDDVGSEPASLALMSLLRPDVIKLDMSLVHTPVNFRTAPIVDAVRAEAERHNALVVAEGVQNDSQARTALALGATAAQGWLYGRPGPLTSPGPGPADPIGIDGSDEPVPSTPFAVHGDRPTRRMTERQLVVLLTHLEFTNINFREPALVLSCFRQCTEFGAAMRRRYHRLKSLGMLPIAFAPDLPQEPGLRTVAVARDDALAAERCAIVLGANSCAAVVARANRRPDHRGGYDVFITHDRGLVAAAARSLLWRTPELPG